MHVFDAPIAVDNMSIRELARKFHHSQRKIREILGQPEPKPYTRARALPSVLDPFKPVIDDILRPMRTRRASSGTPPPRSSAASATSTATPAVTNASASTSAPAPRPARDLHPARPRSRPTPRSRLRTHPCAISPKAAAWCRCWWRPGAYSNCPFALALPTERTEAILHGLVEAFAFFGCVPREVWWDNPKTVAPHLFAGRERRLNERYQALASHYLFEPLFCMVRRPQEKPRVEGRVRHLQQDWATPVPEVHDLAELNVHLRGLLPAQPRPHPGRADRDHRPALRARV